MLTTSTESKEIVLFQSGKNIHNAKWYVVDDRVMGGLSQGNIRLDMTGNAVFEGGVSLENNGGFSSIRYPFQKIEVSNYNKVVLIVKGDGNRYQFRIKARQNDAHAYVKHFVTTGEWQTIEIPFSEFIAQYRGRKLDLPQFAGEFLEEIGILIANKQAESFQILIKSLYLR